jgi:S-formylglutathione hydrolase
MSESNGGLEMNFGVFFPQGYNTEKKWPVLYFLAGLTCDHNKFMEKATIGLKTASERGFVMIFPDTSARGAGIEGEDTDWDFGSAAGFYIDATTEKYGKHYNNESYITNELRETVNKEFSVDPEKQGITGHSMGGHGALSLYLKHPDIFKSCSAFAPIANPMNCPWGTKAFTGYLGEDQETWKAHDSTELVKFCGRTDLEFYVDVGTADNFLSNPNQLHPENFKAACEASGNKLTLNMREGYDHSFTFISTFATDHMNYHADKLC